ncbi:MAG: long-chain fatty acid--CoA ligase [Candidatus Eremiobacterota bacterium]
MNLARIITEHSQNIPEATALIYKDRHISYGELEQLTNRLARGLMSLGAGYGEKVALVCPNMPEFVISFFSVLKCGGTIVPVNFLFKNDELLFVLEHSGASSVIIAAPFLPSLLEIRDKLPGLKNIIVFGAENKGKELISYESLIMENSSEPVLYPVSDDDVAAVLYTSGTTGRLKGAMLTHNNIYYDAKATNEVVVLGVKDCFLIVIPLFHSFAMTACMVLGLLSGSRLVLMEKFVPQHTLQAIEDHKVTVFMAVPSIYSALLYYGRNLDRDSFKSLSVCVSGGAPMPEQVQIDFEDFFGCVIIEGDGPTECSPVTSVNPLRGERKIGSIGLPLTGVEMKIVNEHGREVAHEITGEIIVRGPIVMKGYLNDKKATEESIKDGWFHTGDLGKRDSDGYFYIVDRKKDLIITGGMNVYPREVEDLLLKHPSVSEVAVTSKPDYLRGEVPHAFVVLKEGAYVTEKELISYCRQKLAKFKVPREVTFIESLPKSYTGKVLKRILREKHVLEKCPCMVL